MKFRAVISLLLLIGQLFAQPHSFPLNRDLENLVLSSSVVQQYNFHKGIRPFQYSEIQSLDSNYGQLQIETESSLQDGILNKDPRCNWIRKEQNSNQPIHKCHLWHWPNQR